MDASSQWRARARWLPLCLAFALAACGGGGGGQAHLAPQRALARLDPAPPGPGPGSVPTAAQVMDWAQQHHPAVFAGPAATRWHAPYYYRHYPESDAYIGIAGDAVHVLLKGMRAPMEVGRLQDFAGQVSPQPGFLFTPSLQPLFYTPEQSHSFFAPEIANTVDVHFTDFRPPVHHGSDFPSDFVVQAQFSQTLAYFDRSGALRWSRPSAGRFVTVFEQGLLATGDDPTQVDVVDFTGRLQHRMTFPGPVNYARIQAGRLVVLYAWTVPAEMYAWDPAHGRGALIARTRSQFQFPRAAAIDGDLLAVADTFGHRVLVESISTGRVLASLDHWFPNDVAWQAGFLYTVDEHNDRILAFNASTGEKFVVMAPPEPQRWNPDLPAEAAPALTCPHGADPRRSRSSDVCSGAATLYAPNGFAFAADGIVVADTDNSRIVYFRRGRAEAVLVGLNNPTKVVLVPGT